MTGDDTRPAGRTDVDLGCVTRRLTESLAPLLRTMPLTDKLDQLAEAALGAVPGVDHYEISLVDGDDVVVRTGGDLVTRLHAAEHELGEGPCWETTHGGHDVAAHEDIAPVAVGAPPRTYLEAAGQAGVRSHLAVAIRPHRRVLGSVSVLSTSHPRVPLDAGVLTVVGRMAAIAVEEAKLRDGIEAGLRGRTVIGAALGVVMERFGLEEDVALTYLKRRSSASNRKLRDLADEIVATRVIPD